MRKSGQSRRWSLDGFFDRASLWNRTPPSRHVALSKQELQLARLHEFSTERCATQPTGDIQDLPANEILQSLEMHADEFAMRTCVFQILSGNDPVGSSLGRASTWSTAY